MLKDLQRQLKKLDNEIQWAEEHDAPYADINEMDERRVEIISEIMKICRGEY